MRSITWNTRIFLGLCACLAAALAGTAARAQTNPAPYLYPLYPAATPPGGPAFSLTVTGTGFVSGVVVNWNGSPRPTTLVSPSQVTAAITATDIATPKTALITVSNPTPGGGTSNSQLFQVTFPTDPSLGLTFQDSQLSSGLSTARVLVGDFNGDGKPDLVELQYVMNPVTLLNKYTITILLGNGDGTFQTPVTVFDMPDGDFIFDLAAGDLNGDGKLDLVGSFENSFTPSPGETEFFNGTFAFLGNGDGTFQSPVESENDTTLQTLAYRTVIADVNGDGIPDLVRSCYLGLCVELGNGDGTFRHQLSYVLRNSPNLYPPGAATTIAVGDFHNTGKLDIIAGFTPYYLVMLPGNGDGTFGTPTVTGPVDSSRLNDFVVADFDHSGNLDVEAYYLNGQAPLPVDYATAGALSLLLGNGDGTFQPPLNLTGLPDAPNYGLPIVLVPGDFNGDGYVDLAFQNALLLIGNATGPLNHNLISTPSPGSVATADFNGDGRLDLVGIDASNNVHVLLQTSVPDFEGSIINPPYQDVRPGETATYSIAVTSLNGFAGTIQFSASGLPEGAVATFTPPSLTGSGTVTVTITTTKHTPKGSYLVLAIGTSVGITHSGGLRLNVGDNFERFEDFGGTITPPSQTVTAGFSTTYQITIFPLNGFASDVHLAIRDLPRGARATFDPEIVAGGSGTSTLTVTTTDKTPPGTYQLIIAAHGGGRHHENGMDLVVLPSSSATNN